LIPITLNVHDVVEVAVIELIVVSGTMAPVAYTAFRKPAVGALVPPNAETVIDEVPVLVTYTVLPSPNPADLGTTEITDFVGKSIVELSPVIVKFQGPAAGLLNVGIVTPAPALSTEVIPVCVNVCIV